MKPIFYKTVSTETNSHTGICIASEISSIIQDIGPKKLFGTVNDNARNM